jgi:ribosomal protein S21
MAYGASVGTFSDELIRDVMLGDIKSIEHYEKITNEKHRKSGYKEKGVKIKVDKKASQA